jgi:D-mannonate dehydratase
MSSIQEINAQIKEYKQKLKELKQKKIVGYNFMTYFKISSKDHIKKFKGLAVKAHYEYNDHEMDEYGHDASAYLKVSFGDKDFLEINYNEQQGAGTESRYDPTIECSITGTEKAKKLLFKNLNYDWREKDEEECVYRELRDIIKNIVEN